MMLLLVILLLLLVLWLFFLFLFVDRLLDDAFVTHKCVTDESVAKSMPPMVYALSVAYRS